jgi:hypothetical protein
VSDLGFIVAGYLASAVAVGGYAWRVVARGRRLTPTVPEERRRWT